MIKNFFKNTGFHKRFWEERQIDWKKSYLDTWQHPHRTLISKLLSTFYWGSLFEVGCGSGANLKNILMHFKNKQLGGLDVNADAIELAQSVFQGAFFKVGSVEDIMMSDNSADVVLSDMCLIYVKNPHKAIKEIKRVTRRHILFCEFHSDSWYGKMKLRLTSGYHAHDYRKLLAKHGFYSIQVLKFPKGCWDDGNPQKDYGHFILAKVPKRK